LKLLFLNIIHIKNNIMRKLFILSMCIFATTFTMSSCKSDTLLPLLKLLHRLR